MTTSVRDEPGRRSSEVPSLRAGNGSRIRGPRRSLARRVPGARDGPDWRVVKSAPNAPETPVLQRRAGSFQNTRSSHGGHNRAAKTVLLCSLQTGARCGGAEAGPPLRATALSVAGQHRAVGTGKEVAQLKAS